MRQFIDLVENALAPLYHFTTEEDNLVENAQEQGPQTLADVANHMLMINDDLLDDEDDIGDEISENDALTIIRREYVSGTCGAFAVALHDKYGYPIVGMNGGMHIAVRAPDGDIVDFLGKNPLDKVLKRYGMNSQTPTREWTREETIEHLMIDDHDLNSPWNDVNLAKWVISKLGKW